MDEQLTERQRAYVHHVASGMASRQAALAAAYSESFSRVAAHRLGKKPAVLQAIEAAQAMLREKTLFTQEKAVEEIDALIKGALGSKNPNHMAAAKLLELKCKIHGLVREKIEVEHVDMRAALDEARTRVVTVMTLAPTPSAVLTTVAGPAVRRTADGITWGPKIPGD